MSILSTALMQNYIRIVRCRLKYKRLYNWSASVRYLLNLIISNAIRRSFVRSCVHPSVYPSVRLSIRPSVRPSVCPSVRLSIRLSVHPSVCPSVRLSVRRRICTANKLLDVYTWPHRNFKVEGLNIHFYRRTSYTDCWSWNNTDRSFASRTVIRQCSFNVCNH